MQVLELPFETPLLWRGDVKPHPDQKFIPVAMPDVSDPADTWLDNGEIFPLEETPIFETIMREKASRVFARLYADKGRTVTKGEVVPAYHERRFSYQNVDSQVEEE